MLPCKSQDDACLRPRPCKYSQRVDAGTARARDVEERLLCETLAARAEGWKEPACLATDGGAESETPRGVS